tara:strand:+ start:2641 stop:2949 length:309 start_codon:yes stop_codon:yes gene_type:complete
MSNLKFEIEFLTSVDENDDYSGFKIIYTPTHIDALRDFTWAHGKRINASLKKVIKKNLDKIIFVEVSSLINGESKPYCINAKLLESEIISIIKDMNGLSLAQ